MSDHAHPNPLASCKPTRLPILNWLAGLALFAAQCDAGAAASEERFDYPADSPVAWQNGGSGWAGPWGAQGGNGSILIEDGSLTYPGLVVSGAKMHFTGLAGTGTSTSCFRTNATPLTNGTYYVRLLAQNLNEGRRFFGLALFSGGTERMLVGQGSTYENWTINHVAGVSTNNTLQSGVDSSAVALLVVKLELQDGVERVTFWVNPDLSRPEDVTTAVGGTAYLTDNDFGNITRVRIGGGGYSAAAGGDPTDHYLDEISVSSVSPFPPPTLTCMVLEGNLELSWPPECLGWILQVQTNALSTGLTLPWAGVDIPGTDLVTSTNIPISPGNHMILYQLRHW